MAHPSEAELMARLDGRGYRLTGPRRAVVAAVLGHDDGFSAEDITAEMGAAGRATVYRTIRLLLELGVVCKLALQDGRPLYSLAHAGHHHHAVCQRCGGVTDVYNCGVDSLLDNVQLVTGSRILGHRLEVYILCPDCVALESAVVVA